MRTLIERIPKERRVEIAADFLDRMKACGVPDGPMLEKPLPSDLNNTQAWPQALFQKTPVSRTGSEDDTWATVFAALNDAQNIESDTRETFIAYGFREILGVDTEFVGEYPSPRPANRCPCGAGLRQGQPMTECEDCRGSGKTEPDEWVVSPFKMALDAVPSAAQPAKPKP